MKELCSSGWNREAEKVDDYQNAAVGVLEHNSSVRICHDDWWGGGGDHTMEVWNGVEALWVKEMIQQYNNNEYNIILEYNQD